MTGSGSGGVSNPPSDSTLTSIFQVPLVPNNLSRPPVLWTSNEVKTWVGFCIQEFSLPQICLDKFNINGKALLILTKADFLERAPEAGDVLFNVFQHLSRSKGSSLTYNYHGCLKGPVFLSPVKEFSPGKESGGRAASQRPSTSFIPILPHPSPPGVVNKEESPNALQDVPASVLSPAPTEKYSSDSDSCPNDAVPSPPVGMDIDCQNQKTDHQHAYLNLQATSHIPGNDHPESSEGRLLWEFIHQLLEDDKCQNVVCWESQSNLIFRIKNPSRLAELWGLQKNRTNMTYEKLSRALRYYYKMSIIQKVPGKKLTYQFLQHPTQIRRGQRGARPHSQRNYICDENKMLDQGLNNNICPELQTTAAKLSNLSKARSLSPSSSSSSLSDQYSPNHPMDRGISTHNNYPIMSGILDAGRDSKVEVTVTKMSSSNSQNQEKPDITPCKQQEKEPTLPLKSVDNACIVRSRPVSCPLHHSHKITSSDLNRRPPLKKTLSQPVSPSYSSDISRHLSVRPLLSEPDSFHCNKPEDKEVPFKEVMQINNCSEKTGEATLKAEPCHATPNSFFNDPYQFSSQPTFNNTHSSSQGSRFEYDCLTASESGRLHFNCSLQDSQKNPEKLYSINRQNPYSSSSTGLSSYDQSHDVDKMSHCNSTILPANSPYIQNMHRPLKESVEPVSDYNVHQFNSNHISDKRSSTHTATPPLKGVSCTFRTSIPEHHTHLYQPYPVHSRIFNDLTQMDCESHCLKPEKLNLPESRENVPQNPDNIHYGSQITQECNFKPFIPNTNFLPTHSAQSNSHVCPAMINDSSCSSNIDHHKTYTRLYNPSSHTLPQNSNFLMQLTPSAINRSLEYQPDSSLNNDVYMKFEGCRSEQEQPEDLSVSVKT